MKCLKIDWNNPGEFEVVNVADDIGSNVDQDDLEACQANDLDLIRIDTVRGEPSFRRAIILEEGDKGYDENEEKLKISDWELIT